MAKKRRFYQWRCTWCHNDFLIPPDNDMLNHIFINCGGLVECPWCFSYTRLNPKDLKEVKKKIKNEFINFEGPD